MIWTTDSAKEALEDTGLEVQQQRSIEYGEQLQLAGGTKVNIYSTGKITVQGKNTDEKQTAEALFVGPPIPKPVGPTSKTTSSSAKKTGAHKEVFIVFGHDDVARMPSEITEVTIYSDGSCSPNPGSGGWAAVLISSNQKARKEISGAERETTNNRMELRAAIEALSALRRPCRVDIHTDSEYLKKAFSDGWVEKWVANGWKTSSRQPVANQDLWEQLIGLNKMHEVRWHWVKGHSNHSENDRVDQLANEARQRGETSVR